MSFVLYTVHIHLDDIKLWIIEQLAPQPFDSFILLTRFDCSVSCTTQRTRTCKTTKLKQQKEKRTTSNTTIYIHPNQCQTCHIVKIKETVKWNKNAIGCWLKKFLQTLLYVGETFLLFFIKLHVLHWFKTKPFTPSILLRSFPCYLFLCFSFCFDFQFNYYRFVWEYFLKQS